MRKIKITTKPIYYEGDGTYGIQVHQYRIEEEGEKWEFDLAFTFKEMSGIQEVLTSPHPEDIWRKTGDDGPAEIIFDADASLHIVALAEAIPAYSYTPELEKAMLESQYKNENGVDKDETKNCISSIKYIVAQKKKGTAAA